MLVIENGITSPNTNIPDFFMAYWYTIMKLVIFMWYIKMTRSTVYYLSRSPVQKRKVGDKFPFSRHPSFWHLSSSCKEKKVQDCVQPTESCGRKYPLSSPFQELTALLRSMGQNPTDSEVQHMINQVDVDGSGAVEFDEFCHFMVKLMKNHDPENEVKEAYR